MTEKAEICKNRFHKIFEEYTGTNWDEIIVYLDEDKQATRLKSFWDDRKKIADSEIYVFFSQLCPKLCRNNIPRLRFHKKMRL